jgi:hypothetical protein
VCDEGVMAEEHQNRYSVNIDTIDL